MIASLAGEVGHVGLDHLVVVVGGVGLHVHTTPATAATHRTGSTATLATSLVVREDALTLYGFASQDERDMFETVQTVSGVGPRLALAMLSVMGPDDLAGALARGDAKALTRIPGIGPKSAQRLVLELKDKVGMPAASPAAATPAGDGRTARVEEALVGLGWSAKQAADAVAAVVQDQPDAEIAVLLRLALRTLGR